VREDGGGEADGDGPHGDVGGDVAVFGGREGPADLQVHEQGAEHDPADRGHPAESDKGAGESARHVAVHAVRRHRVVALRGLARERDDEADLEEHDAYDQGDVETVETRHGARQDEVGEEQEAAEDETHDMHPGGAVGQALEVVGVGPVEDRAWDAASRCVGGGDEGVLGAVATGVVSSFKWVQGLADERFGTSPGVEREVPQQGEETKTCVRHRASCALCTGEMTGVGECDRIVTVASKDALVLRTAILAFTEISSGLGIATKRQRTAGTMMLAIEWTKVTSRVCTAFQRIGMLRWLLSFLHVVERRKCR